MPKHTHCRICDTELGEPFLDFGDFPLANSFLDSPDEFDDEEAFPLAVCSCPDCGYMQLDFVVPPEILYRDYIYVSGTSETVRRHADDLADKFGGEGRFVVEIASNDGTVLKAFQKQGARVLGIEPALNIAEMAEAAGISTVPEFFDAATAAEVAAEYGRADVMIARHVFAHVDDSRDFLTGVRNLLADDGTMWIEVPYVGELLEHNEFDTIYHEHLSYVAVGPVARLCEDLDLKVVDVEPISLHGGSILIGIQHAATDTEPSERLREFLQTEECEGYCDPERHRKFADEVRSWKAQFEDFVKGLRDDGAKLVGYGAAAKANTLLCWCPDVAAELEVIFDRSPLKSDKYTPGTHIPVRPPDEWPDYEATHMVILAWNFAEEIRRQMRPFGEAGGEFVVPIPEPKTLT
jgi:novobiocin biosynthesis protein NovU/D-mycarose 3-C-methyltransferase